MSPSRGSPVRPPRRRKHHYPLGVRRLAATLTLALLAVALLAGCGPTATAPNVVGLALDKAHQRFEALDIKEFDDRDAFGDRTAMQDSNWVVLGQDPAAGTTVDLDTKIKLTIGKIGEDNTTARLPQGSPVLEKIRAEAAAQVADAERAAAAQKANAEEQQRREDEARKADAVKRVTSATNYVNLVDPTVRAGNATLTNIKRLAVLVRSGEAPDDGRLVAVGLSTDQLSSLTSLLKEPGPDDDARLDDQVDALVASIERFRQASLTLLTADGSAKASSLQRFDEVYAEAKKAWNEGLRRLYGPTSIKPPLLT